MGKPLIPTGSLNRREFLQACGQVAVISTAYEAVSLVLGGATARAQGFQTQVPDAPLDTLLPDAPIFEGEIQAETGRKSFNPEMSSKSFNPEMVEKSVGSEAERIKNQIRNAVRKRVETRTPAAICGVRG